MQLVQDDLLELGDLHGMLHIRDSLGAEAGFLQLAFIKQALQLQHQVLSITDRRVLMDAEWPQMLQVVLILVQESLSHYHMAMRKLVRRS